MAHWINWNNKQPIVGSQFWIKDELGVMNPNRAYVENDIIYLALDGEDIEYTGQISEWAYELGE